MNPPPSPKSTSSTGGKTSPPPLRISSAERSAGNRSAEKKVQASKEGRSGRDSKEEKLPSPLLPNREHRAKRMKNLRFVLTQHLSSKGYRPSSREEILKRLAILPEQESLFHHILDLFRSEGLLRTEGTALFYCAKGASDYVEGSISFHPRGFAFVRVDLLGSHELNGQDIFIPPGMTLNALPSDRVAVELMGKEARGYDGRVVHIVQRGQNSLYGVVCQILEGFQAVVYVSTLAQNNRCVVTFSPKEPLEIGERVVLKVISWKHKETMILCELVERLGSIEDPSLDFEIAIAESGLNREFPESVLEEALAFGKRVSAKEIAKRRDLRALPTLSIDPDTAKDFDDAISIERRPFGYFLAVHIADVAHYVSYGSCLDREAQKRGNSTYFPNYCLPMLPSELSNELCSLKPNVNRLAVSVLIHFDQEANLIDYEICRSLIKSQKRLTYKEAFAYIERPEREATSKPAMLVRLMHELCLKLKKQKSLRGGIDLNVQETVIKCDLQGQPYGAEIVYYDITHQMIEEFMVKANEIVAKHLSQANRPTIYRIHEAPKLEDFRDFFQLAKFYGHPIKELPTPEEWQQLFQKIAAEPYCQQLTTAYIRSMRLAQYHLSNAGHFGLSLEHYTHFTSPIRRYCDLTVMRALFDEPRHTEEELARAALHSSDRERVSAKAEQSVNYLKKIRLLDLYLKKEPGKKYPAVITKVKPFGVFFDLQEFMLEGFIHISDLSSDYFFFDEPRYLLRGKSSGLLLRIGGFLEVQTGQVDLILRQCQWILDPDWVKIHSQIKPEISDESFPSSRKKREGREKNRHRKEQRKSN